MSNLTPTLSSFKFYVVHPHILYLYSHDTLPPMFFPSHPQYIFSWRCILGRISWLYSHVFTGSLRPKIISFKYVSHKQPPKRRSMV